MKNNVSAAYKATVEYIYDIPKFTKKGGIEQTRALMGLIGNPQNAFKYIHVAGTNGKGSVCALIETALRRCGLKTGLFTSPHLVDINERICINGQMISDEDFVELFNEIKQKVDAYISDGGVHPTFFEWMYMMSMLWFSKQKVEWAVVETGLGGRLDATNVIEKPEITVITSIGYDHMQYLGNTLPEIAGEKAGIIKKKVPLVFDASVRKALDVICWRFAKVQEENALVTCLAVDTSMANHISYGKESDKILYETRLDNLNLSVKLSLLGTYQIANSLVALNALYVLGQKENYFGLPKELFYQSITEAFADTKWPGRMEKINEHLYVDGAHNEEGIKALVKTIEVLFADHGIYLLFAVAEDKDYTKMIQALCGIAHLKGVVVTAIENERRVDTGTVATLFEENGHAFVKQSYNIKEALQTAIGWRENEILCCCGSLYLAGSIKEILKSLKND